MKHILSYLIIVFCFGLFINTDAKADDDLLIICEKGYYQPEIYVRKLTIYEKEKNNSFYSDNRVCNLVISKQKYTEFYNYLISRKRPSDKYYFQTSKSDLQTIKEKFSDTIKKIELEKSQKPSNYYISENLIDNKKIKNITKKASDLFEKRSSKIKEINKEKKISYNFKSNTCEPFESKVSFQNIICISKDDVEDLYNGYKLSPFQSFKKDTYDNGKYIQSSILLDMYPEQMKLVVNKGCASWSCTKKKAGQNVYKMFVQRTERWHSKYPGDIIKAMSWFEILYLGKLNKSEKIIKRYLNSSTDDYFKAKLDKKELKSLIKMNKGRLQMRKAIGLKRDDELSKVFETQWALGIYLNKDKRKVKKNIVDPALKKRRVLLMSYKSVLKRYKEKVAEIK